MQQSKPAQSDHETHIVVWGVSFAGILMAAGLVSAAYLGVSGHRHPLPEAKVSTGVGTGKPAQTDAESPAAKQDPAGQEDPTGGRARMIKATAKELDVTGQQKKQLRQIIASASGPRQNAAGFELMVGTAIPEKTPTADIPPEVTQVMNGYWGDQYVLVADKLIIIDQHTRRVAAIVSGVAE
ncbi:DUF1236 domain-containing protein [Tardiphaga sp.]|jgi:hypothetical protein|uniref:DUF1236 domain-containing protein n=1 Tax=Tardiphaga sp. TaxID=1926292 RepID=UPI0037D9D741